MANEVEIRITAEDDTKGTFAKTEKGIKGIGDAAKRSEGDVKRYGGQIDKVGEAGGRTETTFLGLGAGISGITTLMAGGAGPEDYAMAIADLGDSVEHTAIPAVKGLGKGLGGLRGSLKGARKAIDGDLLGGITGIVKGTGSAGGAITTLKSKIASIPPAAKTAGLALGGLAVGIAAIAIINHARVQRVADSLKNLVRSFDTASLDGTRIALAALRTELEALEASTPDSLVSFMGINIFPTNEAADAAERIDQLKGQIEDLEAKEQQLEAQERATAAAYVGSESAVRGLTDATVAQLNASKEYTDHLRAQTDPIFAVMNAEQRLNEAITHQQEVYANAESSAFDKAAADTAVMEAATNLGVVTTDLNAKIDSGAISAQKARDDFINMAVGMGIPRQEAIRLADRFLHATHRSQELGRQRPTPTVRVQGVDVAISQINAVRGILRNFGGTVAEATLRLRVIGLQEANRARALRDSFSHGGIKGAASGGGRSGLTLVGEHGRELVDLPAGSHVRSNPDTERAFASMSRGAGPTVVINVQGSIRSDRDLVKLVRDELSRGGLRGAFR